MTKTKYIFKKRKSSGFASKKSKGLEDDIVDPSFDHINSRDLLDIETLDEKISSNEKNYREYNGKGETYDLINVKKLSKFLFENAMCGKCKSKQSLSLSVTRRSGLASTLKYSCVKCLFFAKFSNSIRKSYKLYDEEQSQLDSNDNCDSENENELECEENSILLKKVN